MGRQVGKLLLQRSLHFPVVSLMVFSFILTIAGRSNAQGQNQAPQVAFTSLETNCGVGKRRVAFITSPAQLKDGNQARALVIALLPPEKSENKELSPDKVFAVYWFRSIESKPAKRDDDSGVVKPPKPALYNYDAAKLASFFSKAGCDIKKEVVDAIKELIESDGARYSADEFAVHLRDNKNISAIGTPESVDKSLDTTLPLANQEAFAAAVRGLFTDPTSTNGGGDLAAKLAQAQKDVNRWTTEAGNWRARSNSLEEKYNAYVLEHGSTGPASWLSLVTLIGSLALLMLGAFACVVWFSSSPPFTTIRQGVIRGLAKGGQKSPASAELTTILKEAQDKFSRAQHDLKLLKDAYIGLQRSLKAFRDTYLIPASVPIQKAQAKKQETGNQNSQQTAGTQQEQAQEDIKATGSPSPPPAGDNSAGDNSGEKAKVKDTRSLGDVPQGSPELSVPSLALAQQFDRLLARITLSQDSNGLITRLEGLEAGIERLWKLCVGPGEQNVDRSVDELVKRSEEALLLFQTLRKRFKLVDGNSSSPTEAITSFLEYLEHMRKEFLPRDQAQASTPDAILSNLEKKLSEDRRNLAGYEGLKTRVSETLEELGSLKRTNEDVFKATTRIIRDHCKAIDLFSDGNSRSDISIFEKIRDERRGINTITGQIKKVLPDAQGAIEAMFPYLMIKFQEATQQAGEADELRTQRDDFESRLNAAESLLDNYQSQVRLSDDLAGQVSQYLHYGPGQSGTGSVSVDLILKKLENEPLRNRRLRLRLSAAVLAFDDAINNCKRKDVIEALFVEIIKKEMESFLIEIDGLPDDAIWNKALRKGFENQWLHHLLRANLLFQKYLAELKEPDTTHEDSLNLLGDAISQATEAVIATLREFDVEIGEVELLGPPPRQVQIEKTAFPKLRGIREVARKVKQRQPGAGFTVDVLAFPITRSGEEIAKGCVVIVNPSDWGGN
jgi:hypothetical protein